MKRYNSYKTPSQFKVGMLVKWKPGLSNRRMPAADEIGIVSRVLDTPIFDANRKDAGNPYFHEPLDIAVAILDSDGEFIEFHYDSHRLQPVDDADCAPRLVAKLRELLKNLLTPNTFAVGDAVRWKEGLKNKKRPKDDEPAVVAEVLPEVIFDKSKDAGGQYFRGENFICLQILFFFACSISPPFRSEPLELKVAMLDDDDEFVIYHFDARRLEKVPPGDEAKMGTSRPSASRETHEEEGSRSGSDDDAPRGFPGGVD